MKTAALDELDWLERKNTRARAIRKFRYRGSNNVDHFSGADRARFGGGRPASSRSPAALPGGYRQAADPAESPLPEPARCSPHAARYVRRTLARHGRSRPARPRASFCVPRARPSFRARRRGAVWARRGRAQPGRERGACWAVDFPGARGHARRTIRSHQFFGSRRSHTQIAGKQMAEQNELVSLRRHC